MLSRLPGVALATLSCVPCLVSAADGIPPPPPPAASAIVVTAGAEALTAPSAALAAERAAAVPGGTDVVPADEVLRGRAVTLRDALQTSPGVYVQSRQGAEESRLSIRGSGIQRTFHLRGIVLLQDGQPINQADGGGDFQAIDPGVVDHVAVYRGANALHYGAGTLGGAIDFVSPTGYTTPPARVRVEGGSFGFVKGTATGGGVVGAVDGFVGASAYRQEGFRDHARQKNLRAFGNLGWRVADHVENRVYLSYLDSDSELAGALTKTQLKDDPRQANAASALRDSKRDYPLYRVADRLSFASGTERLDLGAGYARKELFHPLGFGLITQDSDDWMGNLRLLSEAPLAGRGNAIVLGVNGYLGTIDARQYGYATASGNAPGALQADWLQTARTVEIYAEERHEVVPMWWAIIGAQGTVAHRNVEDRFLANGDQSGGRFYHGFSPKVGGLYRPSAALQVFANISRSFEPPSFAEFVQRDTSGSTRPQLDLDAQSAWTAELGTRGRQAAVAWDIALYYAWVRDEYLSYQTTPGLTQTVNANRTIHAGIEVGLDTRLATGLFADQDRLVLVQTYAYGRFRFDDDAAYGNGQIPGLPEHTWRGEVRWEHPSGWYGGPVVEFQSGWPVDFADTLAADHSVLLGARAGYQNAHGFSAFVEGKNLTDETYAATTGVANPASPAAAQAVFNPGDGRAVYAGAEWRY